MTNPAIMIEYGKLPRSAFLTFLFGGMFLVVITTMLIGFWNILLASFAHESSIQSTLRSIISFLPLSVVVGLIVSIVYFLSSHVLMAFIASTAVKRYDRLPFWVILAATPVCILLVYAHDVILPDYHFFTATPEEIEAASQKSLGKSAKLTLFYFLPSMIVCWAIVSRKIRKLDL